MLWVKRGMTTHSMYYVLKFWTTNTKCGHSGNRDDDDVNDLTYTKKMVRWLYCVFVIQLTWRAVQRRMTRTLPFSRCLYYSRPAEQCKDVRKSLVFTFKRQVGAHVGEIHSTTYYITVRKHASNSHRVHVHVVDATTAAALCLLMILLMDCLSVHLICPLFKRTSWLYRTLRRRGYVAIDWR